MSNPNQANFQVWWNQRDWFYPTQRSTKRIGDVGEVSDAYTERAYNQFKEHSYHKLAKIQDEFMAPDPIDGTQGRENNRNYNRMEYDYPTRYDGKGHDEVMKEVEDKQALTVDNILNAFKNQGYTLNTTASAIGVNPISMDDYDGQITK
jgi:hypothetical protein